MTFGSVSHLLKISIVYRIKFCFPATSLTTCLFHYIVSMGISEAGEMGLGLTSSITSEVLGIKAISSIKIVSWV